MPEPMRQSRGSRTPVAAAQDLDPKRIIEDLGPLVWALCRRLDDDCEDAYQDVWDHLLRRLDRFDPDRGTLRAWVTAVAHRKLVDRHRRRKVRAAAPFVDVADPGPGADEELARRRRRLRLERALASLPAEQRRVVIAHHLHGQELEGIAAAEGVAVGTVKSRLHRGRAKLAKRLRRDP